MGWYLTQDPYFRYPPLSPPGTMLGGSMGLLFSGTATQALSLSAGSEPLRPKIHLRRGTLLQLQKSI